MKLFRRSYEAGGPRRTGLFEDLEQLLRRVRAVGLAAPLLLVMGFGVGNVTNRVLEVPEGREVRVSLEAHVPRVHLELLSRHMERLRSAGSETVDYVTMYQEHVAPVEAVLRKRGVNDHTARQVAWPLVQHSYRVGLDPAFVTSIVLIESGGRPNATSFVGARGLMQVMPLWAGNWRACGRDLYDIDGNLCHGTNILKFYLDRTPGDERRALLGYNGCVRGTNTPNCHTYPDKVTRLKHEIQREMNMERNARLARVPGAAAAP
ncbi:MAG TPA: lytic transglycosylase domain-containing protein [Longimicrobiales bacterium]|nr:lytic transglycosylase domain-containing protein [Longimicrobiales bacterium]